MTSMEALIKLDSLADVKELLHLSQSALHILLIIILAWIFLRLSAKSIRLLKAYSINHTGSNLEDLKRIETLGRVFHYASSVVIYVVAGMVILSEMGVSIAPILAT
ncbi:MAG: mechanosensitive ion channel family protein, partial [Sulfuriferula sp.]